MRHKYLQIFTFLLLQLKCLNHNPLSVVCAVYAGIYIAFTLINFENVFLHRLINTLCFLQLPPVDAMKGPCQSERLIPGMRQCDPPYRLLEEEGICLKQWAHTGYIGCRPVSV